MTQTPQAQPSSDSPRRPARAAGRPIPNGPSRPIRPDAQRPWNLRWAGHLFRRAAFGATWDDLQRAVAAGPQQTIDRLLHPEGDVAAFHQAYDENEAGTDNLETARAWWLRRMLLTPHPLLEKLTLFWHGHFAASIDKVGRASMMVAQIQLLRSHALGRFDAMLLAVARDPAMLVWLDAAANHKARPSQALAETFLETYTLGPGVCSPQDVREAARAFSGSFLIQGRPRQVESRARRGHERSAGPSRQFQRRRRARLRAHASGRGTRLRTAARDPQALPLADRRKRTAGRRLPGRAERLVRQGLRYRAAGGDHAPLEPVLFAGRLSPADQVPGRVSRWASPGPWSRSFRPCRWATIWTGLGQGLYEPPGAKGWAGGRAWINAATMLARNNLAWAILSGSGRYGEKVDPAAVAGKHGHATAGAAGRFFADLLLQDDVKPAAAANGPSGKDALRRAAYAVIARPEFQLA